MKLRKFKCKDKATEATHFGSFYWPDDADIAEEDITYRCLEENKTLICLLNIDE